MAIRRKKSLIDSAAEFAETVLPTIEHAVDAARDKAGPILAEASALAQEKAHAAREAVEGAASDLTHSDSGKSKSCDGKGRLKKALIAGGLLAVVGVIVKTVLSRKQADDNWQSAYEPPAPPAHKAPAKPADPAAPAEDDAAETDAANTDAADEAGDEPVTDQIAEAAADEPETVTEAADVQAHDDADKAKD